MVKGVMDFYKAIFVSRINEKTEICFQLRFYIFIITLSYTSAKFEGLLLYGKDNIHGELENYLLVFCTFCAIIYFLAQVMCLLLLCTIYTIMYAIWLTCQKC